MLLVFFSCNLQSQGEKRRRWGGGEGWGGMETKWDSVSWACTGFVHPRVPRAGHKQKPPHKRKAGKQFSRSFGLGAICTWWEISSGNHLSMCLCECETAFRGNKWFISKASTKSHSKREGASSQHHSLIIKTLKGSNPFGLLSYPAKESQLIRQPAQLLQAFLWIQQYVWTGKMDCRPLWC